MLPKHKYYGQYGPTAPAYNVIRIAGQYISNRASKYFSGRMLEVGCGTKAKHLLVGQFVDEHIGLDHINTPHTLASVDICGTAYALPIEAATYDCILSTSVLEHLETPQAALQEAFRVLKPGGHAIYTMPLFWHIHEEPRDFFRYTKYGLDFLFQKAGFELIEITALSGFWVTFLSEWAYYLQRFKLGPIKYIIDLLVIFTNWLSPILDQGVLRDEKFTWMYLVVVRKPTEDVKS